MEGRNRRLGFVMSVVHIVVVVVVLVVMVVESDKDSGWTSTSSPHFKRRNRHIKPGNWESINVCKLE